MPCLPCLPTHFCCYNLFLVPPTHKDASLNSMTFCQVEAGSRTILAIVGEEDMVNNVTGSLKLL